MQSFNNFRIYWPLLKRLVSEIVAPMVAMDLSFEEFVALKALVSIQGSKARRPWRHSMFRFSDWRHFALRSTDSEAEYGLHLSGAVRTRVPEI